MQSLNLQREKRALISSTSPVCNRNKPFNEKEGTLFVAVVLVLQIKPRALRTLSRHSNTELHSQPLFFKNSLFYLIWGSSCHSVHPAYFFSGHILFQRLPLLWNMSTDCLFFPSTVFSNIQHEKTKLILILLSNPFLRASKKHKKEAKEGVSLHLIQSIDITQTY